MLTIEFWNSEKEENVKARNIQEPYYWNLGDFNIICGYFIFPGIQFIFNIQFEIEHDSKTYWTMNVNSGIFEY